MANTERISLAARGGNSMTSFDRRRRGLRTDRASPEAFTVLEGAGAGVGGIPHDTNRKACQRRVTDWSVRRRRRNTRFVWSPSPSISKARRETKCIRCSLRWNGQQRHRCSGGHGRSPPNGGFLADNRCLERAAGHISGKVERFCVGWTLGSRHDSRELGESRRRHAGQSVMTVSRPVCPPARPFVVGWSQDLAPSRPKAAAI